MATIVLIVAVIARSVTAVELCAPVGFVTVTIIVHMTIVVVRWMQSFYVAYAHMSIVMALVNTFAFAAHAENPDQRTRIAYRMMGAGVVSGLVTFTSLASLVARICTKV